MTVGTSNPMGSRLAGEFEQVQKTAATDIMTFTGASGQTGDFLVCRIAAGTEKFVVDVSGNVAANNVISAGYVSTKHSAASSIALSDLGTDGGLGVGIITGTAQLYTRQNGTLYRVALTAA